MLSLLLAAHAKLNIPTMDGNTPVHIAAMMGLPWSSMRRLVEAGADVNIRNKRREVGCWILLMRRDRPEEAAFLRKAMSRGK